MIAEKSFTVLTCHYGESTWVKHTIAEVKKFGRGLVHEVVIVDQNRGGKTYEEHLKRETGANRIISFPVNQEQLDYLGYDHGHALDSALRSLKFSTTHVVVLDSDCFPTKSNWLDFDDDVIVAQVPERPHLSHPCFMVFPVEAAPHVSFSLKLLPTEEDSSTFDTGRLVGAQLLSLGYSVNWLRAKPAFHGLRGYSYKEGAVYHHKHGSLSTHALKKNEDVYFARLSKGKFTLTVGDVLILLSNRLRASTRSSFRHILRKMLLNSRNRWHIR